jgi:hypothetical protein
VIYQAAVPTITASYAGFVNVSSVTSPAVVSSRLLHCHTVALLDQAQPPHVPEVSASNYTIFVYVAGAVTVTKRTTLTITASGPTVIYGAAVPHHHRELRRLVMAIPRRS